VENRVVYVGVRQGRGLAVKVSQSVSKRERRVGWGEQRGVHFGPVGGKRPQKEGLRHPVNGSHFGGGRVGDGIVCKRFPLQPSAKTFFQT